MATPTLRTSIPIALLLSLRWGFAAGSEACATCHQAIYDSYRATPMARSSGPWTGDQAREQFDRASFDHAATGFRYRIWQTRGVLSFEFAKSGGGSRGLKSLPYFIGSGATARSYLIEDAGFLFEAPVAYYAKDKKWGLAPAYDTYAYPYLTRPAMPGCLTCHASFLSLTAGTQNRYANPPFREGGVACERCHGPGEEHIRRMQNGGAAPGPGILNPAKLQAEQRDSICAQCHLSGEVRVMRAGRDWQAYQPGARLSDSQTVFIRSGITPGMRVTSHVEKLAQSACKQSSGDRLWCGTCHDPHILPKPADRAAWFRGKCLTCHDTGSCKETRAARARQQDDCTACHMPKSTVTDAQHVVYTDHSIPRRPRTQTFAAPGSSLAVFGGGTSDPRDLAVALGIVASRTHDAADQSRALAALQNAERNAPEDVEVLLYLAELYRTRDESGKAVPLYERAIRLDPTQVTASVGLGGIQMERGNFAEAIRLWQDALSKNAGLELVRINMAMAQWRLGDLKSAEATLQRAIDLNPGFTTPVDLLQKLKQAPR